MVKGDYYLRVVFCSGPTSGSLQGAFERMSEETNVGGVLSSGSGEVWIYGISVGLGLAEEKQFVWVDSALVPQGGGRRKGRERKTVRRMEHSPKVQPNVQQFSSRNSQVFISTRAQLRWSILLWFVHIVNALNKMTVCRKIAAWVASHSKNGCPGKT